MRFSTFFFAATIPLALAIPASDAEEKVAILSPLQRSPRGLPLPPLTPPSLPTTLPIPGGVSSPSLGSLIDGLVAILDGIISSLLGVSGSLPAVDNLKSAKEALQKVIPANASKHVARGDILAPVESLVGGVLSIVQGILSSLSGLPGVSVVEDALSTVEGLLQGLL